MFSLIDSGYTQDLSRHGARRKILVVDDNETNLQSADIALQSYGHEVHTVNDGNAALEILRHENFDLVFMDMHMPGMSGLDVSIAYGRASETPVPVVILTADATRTANTDADIPEVAGFLTKPIKPSELQHAVERYATKPGANTAASASESAAKSTITPERAELFSRSNYMELLGSGVGVEALEVLVANFRADARSIIGEIRQAAAVRDRASVAPLLHKLKGSAGAMHFDGILDVLDGIDGIADDELCATSPAWCASLDVSVTKAASQVLDFIRTNADGSEARTA